MLLIVLIYILLYVQSVFEYFGDELRLILQNKTLSVI